ncbi:sirohydrochlorin cobaltochelatase [Brenneria roseae subsp. roseae]|uniref:sirohydrochlorin cobaltochelatase n=1 Tax=Brenneria roseae TaxID=1509241 RepID=UPI000D60815C|nr:sirohydrochlorin cobaltochelatase [Brenneria roseae]PWC19084.1 sirohydrochlorin cobaltochelatase [Brenneria roseae subsp. roseae]
MKKALLIISFGTSYQHTRQKNIDACEQHLAAHCRDRDLFRAFTSEMIIRKLRNRDGLLIDNPRQALQRLADEGYQDVAVQSLHVINGDEYEKVVSEARAFSGRFQRLVLGVPLLSRFADYQQLMTALEAQMPPLNADERVVFMGHGASHHAFSAYACLDHLMTARNFPALVGAVESYPEIDHIIGRLQQQGIRKVHLMPLMLVAGDHAINDMASDDADSWKSQLEAAGIATQSWLQGLGENPLIRDMFSRHLDAALCPEPSCPEPLCSEPLCSEKQEVV